jgi:hypothetical protein
MNEQWFHGELRSDDAQTAADITLYGMNGATITLGATQRLVLLDIDLVVGAEMEVSVFADADDDGNADDGELVVAGSFAANGGISRPFPAKHYCRTNAGLKVKASAEGRVICIVRGYVSDS